MNNRIHAWQNWGGGSEFFGVGRRIPDYWRAAVLFVFLIIMSICFPFTQEKKALKEEKMKQEEKYTWAIVDGVKEKVISCSLFSCYFLLILIQLLWPVIDHYVLQAEKCCTIFSWLSLYSWYFLWIWFYLWPYYYNSFCWICGIVRNDISFFSKIFLNSVQKMVVSKGVMHRWICTLFLLLNCVTIFYWIFRCIFISQVVDFKFTHELKF